MSSYGAEHSEDGDDYGGDDYGGDYYDGERPELEAIMAVTVSLEAEMVHRFIALGVDRTPRILPSPTRREHHARRSSIMRQKKSTG
jgi:hypothetical protein